VIGLMDTPRAAAVAALARLRELGITRMIMISGDHQRVAEAIAKEVGLDEAWGDLMPEDKVEAIEAARRRTRSPWSATASTMRRRWPTPPSASRWARPDPTSRSRRPTSR
jgi:magnesium-transporting ATPase (P-type)